MFLCFSNLLFNCFYLHLIAGHYFLLGSTPQNFWKILKLQTKQKSYNFLVKDQWFEKLTKGTALGGLSSPNNIPMSPLQNHPTTKHFLGTIEKQKNICFNSVLIVLSGCPNQILAEKVLATFSKDTGFLIGDTADLLRGVINTNLALVSSFAKLFLATQNLLLQSFKTSQQSANGVAISLLSEERQADLVAHFILVWSANKQ